MKQKELLTMILIAAVTSIIVFFIFSQFFGPPLFSPIESNIDTPGPDLIISELRYDDLGIEYLPGQSYPVTKIKVHAIVKNVGSLTSGSISTTLVGSFVDWNNGDPNCEYNGGNFGSFKITPPLNPGETFDAEVISYIGAYDPICFRGQIILRAEADNLNEIRETNEDNNRKTTGWFYFLKKIDPVGAE